MWTQTDEQPEAKTPTLTSGGGGELVKLSCSQVNIVIKLK